MIVVLYLVVFSNTCVQLINAAMQSLLVDWTLAVKVGQIPRFPEKPKSEASSNSRSLPPSFSTMSKGMWTKCLTAEGKAFYYNAAQNRSVWVPPSEAVVHEAPNLKFAPPDGHESAFAQPQPPQSAISNDQPTYVDEEAAQAARNDAM